jgi:hypothetical protein
MMFVEKLEITPVLALIALVVIVEAIKKIVLIVLARIELVKNANVDRELGILAIPPLPLPGGAPLILDTQRDRELM